MKVATTVWISACLFDHSRRKLIYQYMYVLFLQHTYIYTLMYVYNYVLVIVLMFSSSSSARFIKYTFRLMPQNSQSSLNESRCCNNCDCCRAFVVIGGNMSWNVTAKKCLHLEIIKYNKKAPRLSLILSFRLFIVFNSAFRLAHHHWGNNFLAVIP